MQPDPEPLLNLIAIVAGSKEKGPTPLEKAELSVGGHYIEACLTIEPRLNQVQNRSNRNARPKNLDEGLTIDSSLRTSLRKLAESSDDAWARAAYATKLADRLKAELPFLDEDSCR